MPFLIVVLVLLGLILLILFVPVFARIGLDGELRVTVYVLGVPVRLLTAEEKPDKPPKPGKKAQPDAKPADKKKRGYFEKLSRAFREDAVGATLDYLGQLAALAVRTLGRALRAITVDRLWLDMRIATDDAADTAVRYGQVCGVLFPALAVIERLIPVRMRGRRVRVQPDFTEDSCAVWADIRLHVRVYQLVGVAIAALFRFLTMKDNTNTGR